VWLTPISLETRPICCDTIKNSSAEIAVTLDSIPGTARRWSSVELTPNHKHEDRKSIRPAASTTGIDFAELHTQHIYLNATAWKETTGIAPASSETGCEPSAMIQLNFSRCLLAYIRLHCSHFWKGQSELVYITKTKGTTARARHCDTHLQV
jgi:hypothetical protein